jgi:hypothetical protein
MFLFYKFYWYTFEKNVLGGLIGITQNKYKNIAILKRFILPVRIMGRLFDLIRSAFILVCFQLLSILSV